MWPYTPVSIVASQGGFPTHCLKIIVVIVMVVVVIFDVVVVEIVAAIVAIRRSSRNRPGYYRCRSRHSNLII